MRVPDFLIIGAMKAGTTTLYRDLLTNPSIFMPQDKEPESLASDEVCTAGGLSAYAALFRGSRPDQRCGEASTAYSKAPDIGGVPARARQVLGPNARIIYLVREPVARILSHHHHALTSGEMTERDIGRAIDLSPELINWTRYAMQVRPWIDAFGPANVRIVPFESYTANRRAEVERLCAWIGVPARVELVRADAIYNRGDNKPVAGGTWARIMEHPVYRGLLRPFLSVGVRERLRRWLLPKASPRPAPPREATVDRILGTLEDDLHELQRLMGRSEPVWNLEAVRARFLEREAPLPAAIKPNTPASPTLGAE